MYNDDLYFEETAYGMDPNYDPVPWGLVGDNAPEYLGDWEYDDDFDF